jgi:hypothetical protein
MTGGLRGVSVRGTGARVPAPRLVLSSLVRPSRRGPALLLAVALAPTACAPTVSRAPERAAATGEGRGRVPEIPAAPNPQAPPGNAGTAPDATAACVDRELQRRGLDAYGEPLGTTTSPALPPAVGPDRIDRVLARYPEIRTTCKVPEVGP